MFDINSELIGARDLIVSGESYNVTFAKGSCVDLFGGCDDPTDFDFDLPGADAASEALMNQVFIDNGLLLDSHPWWVKGCVERSPSRSDCNILTPWGPAHPNVSTVTAVNSSNEYVDLPSIQFNWNVSLVDQSSLSFAGLETRIRGNANPACGFKDVDGDGVYDLVCQFLDDPSNWSPDGIESATLAGNLLDGSPFEGSDSICVVP